MTSAGTRIFLNTEEIPYYEQGSQPVTISVGMNELPRLGEFIDILGILEANMLEGEPEFTALRDYLLEVNNFPYVKDIVHGFVKEELKNGVLRKKEYTILQHVYLHMAMAEEEQ